jgi:hypothetical protein
MVEEAQPRETLLRPRAVDGIPTHVAEPPTSEESALRINALIVVRTPEEKIRLRLREGLAKDPHVSPVWESLQAGQEPPEGFEEFALDESGLLTDRGFLYIPDDEDLKVQILKMLHDGRLAGHFGREKTYDLVQREFTWPGMQAWVAQYVATCNLCQRNRRPRAKPMGELVPLPAATAPWKSITWDHITDLPESKGFDSILVIVCRFSKRSHFLPCRMDQDTEGLAELFVKDYVRLHGLPDQIISDRGLRFTSNLWADICKLSKIERSLSTAYHPESDGQTERNNSTLEQYLRTYVSFQQDDWASLLPMAEFAYNNSYHSAIKMSPFMASEGREYRFNMAGKSPVKSESATAFAARMQKLWNDVHANLEKAWEDMRKYADRKRWSVPEEGYEVGDWVMLLSKYIKTIWPSKKLDWKTLGPFQITSVVGDGGMARPTGHDETDPQCLPCVPAGALQEERVGVAPGVSAPTSRNRGQRRDGVDRGSNLGLQDGGIRQEVPCGIPGEV